MRRVRLVAVLAAIAVPGCGVRAPAPVDVTVLLAARGPEEARRDLEIRILAEPRDVQARLAAAELDDRLGRPSAAIEQLEAVERLGGPIGTRWHDADRLRFAKLIAQRGRIRLAREAASALGDLERAVRLGAQVAPGELAQARAAHALAQLRHVDASERAHGRAELAAIAAGAPPRSEAYGAKAGGADGVAAWEGAGPHATPAAHGAFGGWLWARGANREAYEQLALWHDAPRGPHDPPLDPLLEVAFFAARAWWDPTAAVAALSAPAVTASAAATATSAVPGAPAAPPIVTGKVPGFVTVTPSFADARTAAVVAYARARVAAVIVAGLVGTALDSSIAHPLDDRELAAAGAPTAAELAAIAAAFRRDPEIAERYGRELISRAPDRTLGLVAVAAVFDALGDPARARTAWLAASEDNTEPAIVAGYAAAAARAGDGDAALVSGTGAAAASGDPAATWLDVAHALLRGRRALDALTAMRSAMDLAGANTLAETLDVAIEASRIAGRDAQADHLAGERARLAPAPAGHAAEKVLLAELAHHAPNASVLAAAWVASRGEPTDIEVRAGLLAALEPDDPRRATLASELVALAGDRDPDRGLAAALSLP